MITYKIKKKNSSVYFTFQDFSKSLIAIDTRLISKKIHTVSGSYSGVFICNCVQDYPGPYVIIAKGIMSKVNPRHLSF